MELRCDVCVVGGGPAGLMLALNLARRGRQVVVLEKSETFERSFRGESVVPDAVWMLHRNGILESLSGEYLECHSMNIVDGGKKVLNIDFRKYGRPFPFPIELPQPTLLNALTRAAEQHPGFTLRRRTAAVGLIERDGRVTGVRAESPDGPLTVNAALTVGADGRYSKVRDMAGIAHDKRPLARDVLWFTLPYPDQWQRNTYRVRIRGGHHAIFLPTQPDMVRVGLNLPKGGLRETRAAGIEALHAKLDQLAPELGESVRSHLTSWKDTMLLDIFTTTVPRWSIPGLVLIGDAAHTLSPILGQGVNHSIMDAVTLAELVDDALAGDEPPAEALDRAGLLLQKRRERAVQQARGLQLRQERLFALAGPVGGIARRLLYRFADRVTPLKRRIISRTYYRIDQLPHQNQQREPRVAARRPG